MSYTIIAPNGTASVTLTANQKIAVQSNGAANVLQDFGFPNYPDQYGSIKQLNNETWVSSAFSSGALLQIQAGPLGALFSVGLSPVISAGGLWQIQGAPADIADGGSMAFAASDLLGGIVTSTPTAGRNIQLPTAANLNLATSMAVGESFDFSLITLAAFALTITVNTGVTIVGSPATAGTAGAVALFRVRKDSATSFIVYRVG